MRDQRIARALAALHGDPRRRWTTEDLAHRAGMSRSAFADRFARAIGEPPMRYLGRLRLEQAAERLASSVDPVARIAYEVGYESESAFTRAFTRAYGDSPAAWRRARQGSRDPAYEGS
jgi:AraC-like DNA-binding protein